MQDLKISLQATAVLIRFVLQGVELIIRGRLKRHAHLLDVPERPQMQQQSHLRPNWLNKLRPFHPFQIDSTVNEQLVRNESLKY